MQHARKFTTYTILFIYYSSVTRILVLVIKYWLIDWAIGSSNNFENFYIYFKNLIKLLEIFKQNFEKIFKYKIYKILKKI